MHGHIRSDVGYSEHKHKLKNVVWLIVESDGFFAVFFGEKPEYIGGRSWHPTHGRWRPASNALRQWASARPADELLPFELSEEEYMAMHLMELL